MKFLDVGKVSKLATVSLSEQFSFSLTQFTAGSNSLDASSTVTTCQKAKVLTGFHQPSVDTVSRLELSSDYLRVSLDVKKTGVFKSHWLLISEYE